MFPSHRSDGLDSSRSREEKQARLASARQRQRELQRHGVAASVMLRMDVARCATMCRSFTQWRLASAALATPPPMPTLDPHESGSELPAGGGRQQVNRLPLSTMARAMAAAQTTREDSVGGGEETERRLAQTLAQLAQTERERTLEQQRAARERSLLREELSSEWKGALVEKERSEQAALVAHLYEKQELISAHHKAMQRAEFDRLDMLAQQEARTKLRETQMFDQAMREISQLRSSLTERAGAAEELLQSARAGRGGVEHGRAVPPQQESAGREGQGQEEGDRATDPATQSATDPAPESAPASGPLSARGSQGSAPAMAAVAAATTTSPEAATTLGGHGARGKGSDDGRDGAGNVAATGGGDGKADQALREENRSLRERVAAAEQRGQAATYSKYGQ